MTPDKSGARGLYTALRASDFHAVIHWQTAEGEIVTTFKTYHGTHKGAFLGIPPTGKKMIRDRRRDARVQRQDTRAPDKV